MNNPDILSVIAPMTDERSLRLLFADPTLRPILRVILSSQNYWYERAQYLIGWTLTWRPKAVWKDVYYVLLHLQSSKTLSDMDVIDNLDSLLAVNEAGDQFMIVYAQAHGAEDEPNPNCYYYLSNTANLDVLDYVLERSQGKCQTGLWDVLERQLCLSHMPIVDKLLTLASDDDLDEDELEIVLTAVIIAKRRDIFDRLEGRIDDCVDIEVLFEAAMQADDLEMYNHLLDGYEIDTSAVPGILVVHDS